MTTDGLLVVNISEYTKKGKLAVIGRVSWFSDSGYDGFTGKEKTTHTRIRVQMEYGASGNPYFVSYVTFRNGGVVDWYNMDKLERKLRKGADEGNDDYSVESDPNIYIAESEAFNNHLFDDYTGVNTGYKKTMKDIPTFRGISRLTNGELDTNMLEECLTNIFVELKGDSDREKRKKLVKKLLNKKYRKRAIIQLIELDYDKYGGDDYLNVFTSRICTLLSIAVSVNTIKNGDAKFSDSVLLSDTDQRSDEENNHYLEQCLKEAAEIGLDLLLS